MAVVFAFLIKNTNYVSTKNTTNSSVNYSKNNKRYCHVYILLLGYFRHEVMRIFI